jgi:hypothetical protein
MVTVVKQNSRAVTVALNIHNHERTAGILRKKYPDLDIRVEEVPKERMDPVRTRPVTKTNDNETTGL